jgi:hypothetical protein
MGDHNNIDRIKAVFNALEELRNEVVFVGGATISLYADIPTIEIRPTLDVDILVELYSRVEYAQLEEKLRNKGFVNDVTAKFLGRYILDGVIVDVMPTDEEILGFSNRWYKEGYAQAIDYKIDEQHTVKIFPAPYFIASKIEAFKARGKNKDDELDGRISTDFEDMIFVFENRITIWNEINEADENVRTYLKTEFAKLLSLPYFEEWVASNVNQFGSPPADYYIIPELKKIAGMN